MDYTRVNWENLPSTNTPVNADNLNKMDEVIANIDTKINSKANIDDVYTKTQLNDGLLPMTMINGINIRDNGTATFEVEKIRPYIFINSHIFNREIVLITMFESVVNIDRLINTTDLSSFTLNGNELTIKGAGRCRGKLYKLNYQVTA